MVVAPGRFPAAVVIDDDPDVRLLLVDILAGAGFATVDAANGVDGIEAVREHDPVVVTVDVDMPGIDGFETIRRIRDASDPYVVLVTAASDEASAVLAFGMGADDVVVKPFRARELRARLLALTRRARTSSAPDRMSQRLLFRSLDIDLGTRSVTVGDEPVGLTRTEFDLLVAIIKADGRVLSRRGLVLMLHGDDYSSRAVVTTADERALETHVTNLRRKLGDNSSRPRFIETVRGVGYRAAKSTD